jgi:hypothetical protein
MFLKWLKKLKAFFKVPSILIWASIRFPSQHSLFSQKKG